MKKQFTETSPLRKSFSNPQIRVIKMNDDVISTSTNATFSIKAGQKFDEEEW